MWLSRVPRRELVVLGAIALLGLTIRVAFVLLTKDHTLAGDEIEYDIQGRFIADGQWFWSTAPYGIPHESMWKAPLYPVWVGLIYELLGSDPDRALLAQTLLGPLTIVLTWALGRRLFGSAVGLGAAAVVALHPFAWQFETRLFAESIVTPLTMVILLLVLEASPTKRRVAVVGALIGILLLARPSSLYLLPAVAVAWLVASGWRRGLALAALTLGISALVVAPWTIRNYELSGHFVPISVQDAAPYGVFNDDAANDPLHPWGWRPTTTRDSDVLDPAKPLPEAELRDVLRERTIDYIKDHPSSVLEAFYWNGLVRLWDVRSPARALDEVPHQGREELPSKIGLGIHYLLLPLALAGLWLVRRRRAVLLPLVTLIICASVVFTAEAGTRYRAPFEPLIAIMACSTIYAVANLRRERQQAEPDLRRTSGEGYM